jgi:peptide/nickel transport system ATP-binding protein
VSLKVDNLTVYYQTLRGNVQALEQASFEVANGEIMGLAGESGCGKTTLSTSLIMLTPPMKHMGGSVLLDDEVMPIADEHKMVDYRFKKVSIIPQYAMSAMNPTRKIGMLTRELIEAKKVDFNQVLPELKRRLELVELPEKVLNMYPIELSGGMKQRMVMVLSTLLNPSLLIADEITSALDVSTQKAVMEMLGEFRDRKYVKSMMIITHDISVLYQIADSIMVMYAGQLSEKAAAETIIREPRHPYTKMLIAALPKIGVRYSEQVLSGIPGKPPLLLDPPAGCRFRERCPAAFGKCLQAPPFKEVQKDHFVACWKEFERHA